MTSQRKNWLWGSALSLLIGGTIYVLLRTQRTLLNILIGSTETTTIDGLRQDVTGLDLPEWLVYNLPGGLWAASYILLSHVLTFGKQYREKLLWASIIPAVGIGSELMQGLKLLPGTADGIDMLFYALPWVTYYTYLSLNHKTYEC